MTTRTRFTAYVTKYALNAGILKIVAEENYDIADGFITQVEPKPDYPTSYHKGDWVATEYRAKERAEEMRRKKLASLRKQIVRLGKLEIKVVEPGRKTR